VEKADQFDFAVLVVAPDDLIQSRGTSQQAPRDNVLIEIGLFVGILDRERTFVVFERDGKIKLPTDLAGVTLAGYQRPVAGPLQAALGGCCAQIRRSVASLGVRVKVKQLIGLQGRYSVHRLAGGEVEGERVEFRFIGRRTFSTRSTKRNGDNWEGHITLSDELPGYGHGVFRYIGQAGCGLQQIWINAIDGSIYVHGMNTVGGSNPHPFEYTLRRMNE
jgi:hypothetical protein